MTLILLLREQSSLKEENLTAPNLVETPEGYEVDYQIMRCKSQLHADQSSHDSKQKQRKLPYQHICYANIIILATTYTYDVTSY